MERVGGFGVIVGEEEVADLVVEGVVYGTLSLEGVGVCYGSFV